MKLRGNGTADVLTPERVQRDRVLRTQQCLEELQAVLVRHRCRLQVQGQWVHPLGGLPRQESITLGVVPED